MRVRKGLSDSKWGLGFREGTILLIPDDGIVGLGVATERSVYAPQRP